MKINIAGCQAGSSGSANQLLQDIARYSRIESWVEAIGKEIDFFRPADCFVIIGKRRFKIKSRGTVKEIIFQTALDAVRNLPEQYKRMPNEMLEIEADAFEKKLYIYGYGKD